MFFFEKKNQKTFIRSEATGRGARGPAALQLDARVPIMLGRADQAGQDDLLLIEGSTSPIDQPAVFFTAQPTHPAGCACCPPRSDLGRALAAALQDRARGKTPFFKRVIAVLRTPDSEAALRAALERDPVVAACYKLTPPADTPTS